MQVGAIVSLSRPQEREIDAPAGIRHRECFAGTPDAGLTILGNSLLQRTTAKLRKAGVSRPFVVREGLALKKLAEQRYSPFDSSVCAWEQALAQSIQQGFDIVLLVGTTSYTDLSYDELLRFHRERGAGLTQVRAVDGSLDIAVVSTDVLLNAGDRYASTLSALVNKRERFSYRGYVNRLSNPTEFMQLVDDALYQRCELRPAASEIAQGLWVADGADIDNSCVISGPSFIGADVTIAACCNVSGGSAIENACHIDSGTTIAHSWVLPDTYVGVGLNVNRSIVGKQKIFHLDRRTEITVTDRRLIGAARSLPLLRTGERLFSRMQFSS